jgi:hypothetical protein
MNVSAFIRSYRKDFPWLRLCLQALQTRGQQFSEIVVAVPQEDFKERPRTEGVVFAAITPTTANGYIDQQITKCHADQYCNGDFIMHFDSDCIATHEINLREFFSLDRLPRLLFRKWQDAGTAETWRLVTRGVLKQEPPFETMASHPFVYHRSTHELFRRHVADLHGGDFVKYASRLAQFSEFNAIGNFCLLYTPEAYQFVRAGADDGFPRPFRQHWSHDREQLAKVESLLQ